MSSLAAGLLGLQAVLLGLALPVVGLTFLGSLWEGGDQTARHRLQLWSPFAVLGNVAGLVLLSMAATAVARGRPAGNLTSIAVTLGVLGVGWAWVFQSELVHGLGTLLVWALWTFPGLVGVVLARRVQSR